jgi:hypothetical protein
VSAESALAGIASRFALPWSAYVRLLAVNNATARGYYETDKIALKEKGLVKQRGIRGPGVHYVLARKGA